MYISTYYQFIRYRIHAYRMQLTSSIYTECVPNVINYPFLSCADWARHFYELKKKKL